MLCARPSPPHAQGLTITTTVAPAPDHTRRNTLAIGLLLVSAFVVILNETIMSVALPELMVDLDINARTAQWLTTGFMLTMAIVIPISGFMLERFTTRQVFITAMTLFSAGTLLAGVAPGFTVLLIGRVIQASGTAIMMPLLMTTVMKLVPADRRGRIMGNVSIVISVAPAIGPTISGFILNLATWRWMFLAVLPIALIMLIVGILRVPNVSEPRQMPIDVFSIILAALGFGGLIFGLSHIGDAESPAWLLPVALAVGVLSLAGFILRQLHLQRSDRALLDLRTFRSRTFTISVLLMVVSMAALFGTIVLLPILLARGLGMDPMTIGLFMLPGGLLTGLLAPFVGRLYDRIGPRPLVVPGTIIVSAAFWYLSTVTPESPMGAVLAGHIVLSLGLSLLFTPLFTASMASVAPHLYAHASATIGTVQQVAGAAGTAIFVTIMSIQSEALLSDGASASAAVVGGVTQAFQIGGIISIAAIVLAFFLSRPPVIEGAEPPVGH